LWRQPRNRSLTSVLARASDDELLELLLGRSSGHLELEVVLDLDGDALTELGLSEEERSRVILAAEIARRHQPHEGDVVSVKDPRHAVALIRDLRTSTSRQTVLLLFGRRMRLQESISLTPDARGHSGCPRIPAAAIAGLLAGHGAASVILAHNHINGEASPTAGDIEFTTELHGACAEAGVEFVDHVIVAQRGWVSLREARLGDPSWP